MNDSAPGSFYEVDGKTVWCGHGGHDGDSDDGGQAHDPARPTLVLLHGALNDHSVWSRLAPGLARPGLARPGLARPGLARRGLHVLAPDLPGHGRSAGPALASVEALAGWLQALLDAAGLERVLLAGHSMGSLVALETAARAPQRVLGLALLGSAAPMRVSHALLAAAQDDEAAAIDTISEWSHADPALRASSRQLMRAVAAAGAPGLLHLDLTACKDYAGGERAIAALDCPVHVILGSLDKMTPPRAAHTLAAAARHAVIAGVDAGHAMMAEQPAAVLAALLAFADACADAGAAAAGALPAGTLSR